MARNRDRDDVTAAFKAMKHKRGSRMEVANLHTHLAPDERVEAMAEGKYGGGDGLLALTDRRLLFRP